MERAEVRKRIWQELRAVARPDSRFHFDFHEYIPDFEGSSEAIAQLAAMEIYKQANVIFITPDNCLEGLRAQALRDGKVLLVTTYGIRRGTVEIIPEAVPSHHVDHAATLDGMEKFGRSLSLAEMRKHYRLDLMVTGASAVSLSGVRFGKGHGFFDVEWAMFYRIGIANAHTPVVAVVHDCQVVEQDLVPDPFDTLCDLILTPTRMIPVPHPQKPTVGIVWERLDAGMLASIPPLQELKQMEENGTLDSVFESEERR